MALELSAETRLLQKILRPEPGFNPAIVVPNGDDAAVFRIGDELIAVTTDGMVEGRHFSFNYYSPKQVGSKAIESSVSDIVAMGGRPQYVFISISLPSAASDSLVLGIYQGVYQAAARVDCSLLGGDITTGTSELVITVSAMGRISSPRHLCTRSAARPGDLVFVTGQLGGSAAGLDMIQKGIPGFEDLKRKHLEARCRVDVIEQIAPHANAMIDVSDGLSSEIHHICRMSKCGAVLDEERIPISESVKLAAKAAGTNALKYAYGGGEDYELLYTIPAEDRKQAVGYEIGVIVEEQKIMRWRDQELSALQLDGWDQLAS